MNTLLKKWMSTHIKISVLKRTLICVLSVKFDPHPGKMVYKMSALALRGNSFYGRMIEGLGPLPSYVPCWVITIPDHLKTQEMCSEAVRINPLSLAYVPDHFRTQGMCNEVVRNKPRMMLFVPDHLITQEMCNEIMRTMPNAFHLIPNRFKTQEMCDKAVEEDPGLLEYVPDWFVTQEQIELWDDDDDYDDDDDKLAGWYNGYKKRKAQKAKIKEELLPIAWHPDRVMNWCVSEDVWK